MNARVCVCSFRGANKNKNKNKNNEKNEKQRREKTPKNRDVILKVRSVSLRARAVFDENGGCASRASSSSSSLGFQ